jgi:hypothetical protein
MTRAVNLASAGSIVSESVGDAPGYMARAWVNFNGTGTVAITGQRVMYRALLTMARVITQSTLRLRWPDANYSAAGMTNYGSFVCLHEQRDGTGVEPSASALRIIAMDHPGGVNDNPWVFVSISR